MNIPLLTLVRDFGEESELRKYYDLLHFRFIKLLLIYINIKYTYKYILCLG